MRAWDPAHNCRKEWLGEPVWFPNFLEEAFSDITVISQQIGPLWKWIKCHHQEIHFPNKENKFPGGEIRSIDDYHLEIHFPNMESNSPFGIMQ